jgi:hypothetical protein
MVSITGKAVKLPLPFEKTAAVELLDIFHLVLPDLSNNEACILNISAG